ncbi:MAG: hypothetical protein QW098_03170 [Candidatus Hadarchaeales archaeon]
MEQARLLAMVSLVVAAAGVILFILFPPSSPELSFVFAAGIAFVLLLLFAVSVMEGPEEEEGPVEKVEAVPEREEVKEKAPETERVPPEPKTQEGGGEVISRLKEALEKAEEVLEPRPEAPEAKARPDLLSWLRQVSLPGWKEVGEGGVKEEAILGRPGTGAEGFFRLWEGERGERLALYTLLFPSPEDARAGLQEVLGKLGDRLYESHPGLAHFHLEKEEIDGAIWRKEEVMALLLVGKAERGESSRFLKSLPEALKPS